MPQLKSTTHMSFSHLRHRKDGQAPTKEILSLPLSLSLSSSSSTSTWTIIITFIKYLYATLVSLVSTYSFDILVPKYSTKLEQTKQINHNSKSNNSSNSNNNNNNNNNRSTSTSTSTSIVSNSINQKSTFGNERSTRHNDDGDNYSPKSDLFPSFSFNKDLAKVQAPTCVNASTTTTATKIKEDKLEDSLVPTSCSMGLTTRLLPIRNSQGELEWVFTDDDSILNNSNSNSNSSKNNHNTNYSSANTNNTSIGTTSTLQGNELDAFRIPQLDNKGKVASPEIHSNDLSPTMSNSSNETTLSQKIASIKKDQTSSPHSIDLNSEGNEDNDEDVNAAGAKSINGDKGETYPCQHCNAVFTVKGYLTRHMKKHSSEKAYKCPFHEKSTFIDDNSIEHKCHPSGGFSRRDTYKTHLKSRHFLYPKDVKTKDRPTSEGHCAMCGEYFKNAEMWCEIHVEGGECQFLPADYKGKSRIKNRLRKKLQRNETITDPELLPYASKVYEEVQEQKKMKRLAKQQRKRQSLHQKQKLHNRRYNNPTQAQGDANQDSTTKVSATSPSLLSSSTFAQQPSPPDADTPNSVSSSSIYDSSSHSPYTPQSHMSKSPLSLMYNQYARQPNQADQDQQQFTASSTNISNKKFTQATSSLPTNAISATKGTNIQTPYLFEQIATAHSDISRQAQINYNDYDDDEFCLDIDQLDSTVVNQMANGQSTQSVTLAQPVQPVQKVQMIQQQVPRQYTAYEHQQHSVSPQPINLLQHELHHHQQQFSQPTTQQYIHHHQQQYQGIDIGYAVNSSQSYSDAQFSPPPASSQQQPQQQKQHQSPQSSFMVNNVFFSQLIYQQPYQMQSAYAAAPESQPLYQFQ